MTEPKFTKGPWHCSGIRPTRYDKNGRLEVCLDMPYKLWGVEQIVDMPDGGKITTITANVVRCGDMSDEELEANAHLIAAAPDLFEALISQHEAIDILFAMLVERDLTFYPSKSGEPWEALQQGLAARRKASEDITP
jgi:hypothetical protein